MLDSDGYIYSSKKHDDTVLSSAWRCQKNKSLKCPAKCYLALTDNTLSLGSKPHNRVRQGGEVPLDTSSLKSRAEKRNVLWVGLREVGRVHQGVEVSLDTSSS